MTSRTASTRAMLFLLLLSGCRRGAAPSGAAEGGSASSAIAGIGATLTSEASRVVTSASAAAEALREDAIECEADICKVQLISDHARAELEKVPGYKSKKLQFREATTNDQFHTVASLPWASRVSIDGCKAISDLSPLAELKSLKELSADDAPSIADISPLAELLDLEKLSIAKTSVDSLVAVKGLTKLTKLDVGITKVTDITPVGALTKLQSLGLGQVKVKDWLPLQKLAGLKNLDIERCDLHSTFVLGAMKGMKKLVLSHCEELKDIATLKNLSELETLKLDDCPITSVAPLSGMLGLHVLSLAGTKITTIAPLSNLTELRSADLQRTQVTDFDSLAASAKSLRYLGLPKGTTSDQYAAVREENPRLKVDVSKHR